MANTVRPRGAMPKGVVLRANQYVAGGTIYPGDLVKQKNDGTLVVVTAGDAAIGVAASYAVSTNDVLVYDHPDQEYVIQSSSANPGAQTDLNLNYSVVATAGSSTYKMSRMALDGTTGNTTASLTLKALNYEKRPDNALSTNCDVVVIINNHQLKGGTGTAGV